MSDWRVLSLPVFNNYENSLMSNLSSNSIQQNQKRTPVVQGNKKNFGTWKIIEGKISIEKQFSALTVQYNQCLAYIEQIEQ